MLPHRVLRSDAIAGLHHAAFRVLVLLAMSYNGKNNGALGVTRDQAAAAGIKSKTTVYLAFDELEEANLITRTRRASAVPPRPAMFGLTWLALDDTEFCKATRLPIWKP